MNGKYKDKHETMFLNGCFRGPIVTVILETVSTSSPAWRHTGILLSESLASWVGKEGYYLGYFCFVLLRCWRLYKIVMTLAMLLNNHTYSGLVNTELEEYCPIKKGRSQVSQRHSRGLGV